MVFRFLVDDDSVDSVIEQADFLELTRGENRIDIYAGSGEEGTRLINGIVKLLDEGAFAADGQFRSASADCV